jgi:hypothetical protein
LDPFNNQQCFRRGKCYSVVGMLHKFGQPLDNVPGGCRVNIPTGTDRQLHQPTIGADMS